MTILPFREGAGSIGFPVSAKLRRLADGSLWNWPGVTADGAVWAASGFTLGSRPYSRVPTGSVSRTMGLRPHLGQAQDSKIGTDTGNVAKAVGFFAASGLSFVATGFLPPKWNIVGLVSGLGLAAGGIVSLLRPSDASPAAALQELASADEMSRGLRRLANDSLAGRWSELKLRLSGSGSVLSDMDVGRLIENPSLYDLTLPLFVLPQAESWRADAGKWLAAIDRVKAMQDLTAGELGRLQEEEDEIRRRWIILSNAGVGLRSPTAAFMSALAKEIGTSIPTAQDYALLVVAGLAAMALIAWSSS